MAALTLDQTIDAHRGGGRGGRARGAPHVPPQKTLKNCNIKMQHNTKIEGPSQIISQPHVPPQKNLKMTVHLWIRHASAQLVAHELWVVEII